MKETIETVEIQPGETITILHVPIIPGVTVKIYDAEVAELSIGKMDIMFAWNDETRDMIENIDDFEAIELLALLAEHEVRE
ncbi:hypothetical protein MKZ02_21105 [Pseudobacillus sp. FSL P4-0506]|uniref:hypothetical protein n=1 Tax=Pseudobacillus sp. FSL P4-0506 TaxID=2921576 RepID=UPI0030F86E1D